MAEQIYKDIDSTYALFNEFREQYKENNLIYKPSEFINQIGNWKTFDKFIIDGLSKITNKNIILDNRQFQILPKIIIKPEQVLEKKIKKIKIIPIPTPVKDTKNIENFELYRKIRVKQHNNALFTN